MLLVIGLYGQFRGIQGNLGVATLVHVISNHPQGKLLLRLLPKLELYFNQSTAITNHAILVRKMDNQASLIELWFITQTEVMQ